MNNFSELNAEDTYSTALLLMFIFSRNDKYSTLSELSYILDHENFLNFIKYYEGQTIEIPPMTEIMKSLRILMLYQYYVVEQLGWRESLLKAGFDVEDTHAAQRYLTAFKKTIENFKIGDVINGTKQ